MTGRLSHPFADTALVWRDAGFGVRTATFNHLAIGGYGLRPGDVVGRVWFGSAKMVEPMSDSPPVTEAAAREWIEATFREWADLVQVWALGHDARSGLLDDDPVDGAA